MQHHLSGTRGLLGGAGHWRAILVLAGFGVLPAGDLAAESGTSQYDAAVSPISPVTAAPGDTVFSFTSPGNVVVKIVVKSPVVTRTYQVPAMEAGDNAVSYFARAIQTAGSGATVVFPKAIYNFPVIDCKTTSDPVYVGNYVLMQSVHDLVIDGQGSTLNFQSDCPGVVFNMANRVAFKNFSIDWPQWQTATVGTVVAVGKNSSGYTFDLAEDPANPLPSFGVATPWDKSNNYWSLTVPNQEIYFSGPIVFGANGIAKDVPSYGIKYQVGQALLARNLTGKSSAIIDWNSQDVTVSETNIYNSPGMAFMIALGRGVLLDHVQVTRSAGRPISTMADAVHFGSFGGDVIIQNSTFSYQGDDGLNIHTGTLPLPAHVPCGSGSGCRFALPASFSVQNGDSIALFNPNMQFLSSQVATCSGTSCSVNVSAVSSVGGYAADLTLASARYVVRNNTFFHNRARGALIQSPYGMVIDNLFEGQSLFAIYLLESSYWSEGPGAQNVSIESNVITTPGAGGGFAAVTMASEGAHGIVYDGAQPGGGATPNSMINQEIAFKSNSLSDLPGAAFYISSASTVSIFGNTLARVNQVASAGYLFGDPSINDNLPILVNDANGVTLSGNTLDGSTVCGRLSVDAGTTFSLSCQ